MRGLRSRRTGEVLFGSAGWLFADLMLALVVMLVLTAALATPDARPDESKKSTTTTTTTPPPTTTAKPRQPRLLPTPVELNVPVNADAFLRNDGGEIRKLRDAVRDRAARLHGRAGVVLIFGPGGTDPGRGVAIARKFTDKVLRVVRGRFAGAAFRAYYQPDLGKVSLVVFVFDG
jgi:hypothetical protein